MSAATTDPALGLVAAPAPDLSPVSQVAQVGTVDHLEPVAQVATTPKERHSLTLDQRRALRRWANGQTIRPSHKACIEWFYSQYGQQISQSTVSHSLSPNCLARGYDTEIGPTSRSSSSSGTSKSKHLVVSRPTKNWARRPSPSSTSFRDTRMRTRPSFLPAGFTDSRNVTVF
ncbi:Homeodomain-like protein [Fusarium solani]|uniref:Homeodomain-like protein n=1 Tax=Fusarium solani TaxID=169388 RepID=A0A9P9L761_FUSSL|nr:Homeodomain-like protein [Fusarium solani]KAH7275149.1 Homeodomain-like protein [Fusarium solani]